MLDHASYDKAKLIHELSAIVWFIENHAKKDAQAKGDIKCHDLFELIAEDIEKHLPALKELFCKC